MVFDGAGDEVIAGFAQSEEGEVVAFGASAGENDLGFAGADEFGDIFSCVFDGRAGLLALLVD